VLLPTGKEHSPVIIQYGVLIIFEVFIKPKGRGSAAFPLPCRWSLLLAGSFDVANEGIEIAFFVLNI
jgi:hypothetical protein